MTNIKGKKSRSLVLKKGLIFQLKLGLDALRDIILSPIAIIALIIDLILSLEGKNSLFNQLMHFGRLSDQWINLFNAHCDPLSKHGENNSYNGGHVSVDELLAQIGDIVKEQQSKGKLSDNAKAKIDGYLAKMKNRS